MKSIIDHILLKTHQKKLNYIGHSQGTTAFFVLTAMRPEYNEKIIDAHLLAPVANLKNTRNQVNVVFSKFYTPLYALFNALGIYRITVSNSMVSKIFEYACKGSQDSTPFTCKLGLAIFGSTQINCVSYREYIDPVVKFPKKRILCSIYLTIYSYFLFPEIRQVCPIFSRTHPLVHLWDKRRF